MADDGVVGCVEPASEGASEASGVTLWVGVGRESCCVSSSLSDTFSSCVTAVRFSANSSRGKTIGSVASSERAIFRFRLAARLGND